MNLRDHVSGRPDIAVRTANANLQLSVKGMKCSSYARLMLRDVDGSHDVVDDVQLRDASAMLTRMRC
jgi:hypothetical protein